MRTKIAIVILSGIFLGLSCLLYQQLPLTKSRHQDIDSSAYLENAKLFSEGGFLMQRKDFPYYTLGYSMIIAFLYKLFGDSDVTIIIAQIIIALLSGLLMFAIAHRLGGPLAGVFSFLFFIFSVGYFVFVQFILTEIFLAFFLLLFFDRYTAFFSTQRLGNLVMAGLALGTSIIIKPAALYYPLLLLPMLFFAFTKKYGHRLKLVCCFSAAFYLPVIGYMAYNNAVFGHFRVGNLAQENLYNWFFPNVLAQIYETSPQQERLILDTLVRQEGPDVLKKAFFNELMRNPFVFMYVWLKKCY